MRTLTRVRAMRGRRARDALALAVVSEAFAAALHEVQLDAMLSGAGHVRHPHPPYFHAAWALQTRMPTLRSLP